MSYDFTGLSETQQTLLTYGGWHAGSKLVRQPSPRTIRPLVERGLLQPYQVTHRGLAVTEYSVPIPVHAAWCQHCSETYGRGRKA